MAESCLQRLSRMIAKLKSPMVEGVDLECKHFFSGAALYANGNICATLTPVGLGLKLPVDSRKELMDAADGNELRHFEQAPIKKEYVAISQALLNDPKRLNKLILQSIEHAVG